MKIRPLLALLAAFVLALAGAPAPAGESAWHASLEDGLAAARKGGRPLLVVTLWPRGV